MFKKRRGIKLPYAKQGLIYFTCLTYAEQPEEIQRKILNLCIRVGGEDYAVLYELMTSGENVRKVSLNHYMSESRLYKLRKDFYENWYK